jgi:NAD(P) transhydrogenase subunit beta
MIPESLATVGYLLAAVLFIQALGGLSNQETARRGNIYGIVGMVIAIGVTLGIVGDLSWAWAIGPVVAGATIGVLWASTVPMTSMPQMVAILNSFVGLGAVFVSYSSFLDPPSGLTAAEMTIHDVEVYVDVAVGALTFTGSVIAYGKLGGMIRSQPLLLPGRHFLNLLALGVLVAAGVPFVGEMSTMNMTWLTLNAGLAGLLGLHMVMAIGGADMPVVVSLLNSYSGWAAAAAGFLLSNDLLIITGALVGSSGAILSYIMCQGMNRSLTNVILGGWGTEPQDGATDEAGDRGEATSVETGEVARSLTDARRVVIVPGYGMAVAGAQHAVSRLTSRLRDAGVEVRFAIHPVAGRMPGHMNVLLAEADVPYDIVDELEVANPSLPGTDVVLVVGANDIVNPDAVDDPSTPIYGMPQIEVWNAERVVIIKRSLSPGYAGVPNPLFYRDNTWMYFGDATDRIEELLGALD